MEDMQGSLKARTLSKITGEEPHAATALEYGTSVPEAESLWARIERFSGSFIVEALMENRRLQMGESNLPITPVAPCMPASTHG